MSAGQIVHLRALRLKTNYLPRETNVRFPRRINPDAPKPEAAEAEETPPPVVTLSESRTPRDAA